ncbi:AAA family ATPase [Nitrospirillum sp. BR 11164]|uniref:AAA family ATPase n=1 Tax=Nitrospirillum sp. BR 11164 TaxID=3104324 RepID=UPI002AFF2B58|nr:AAA family ATPase [Nitrospirillum sp. BR 11164]MEA1649205.1 AAA family ATPase [Nitrospirillum sp. BR 11164]
MNRNPYSAPPEETPFGGNRRRRDSGPANPNGLIARLETVCAASWAGRPVPERQWLVPDLLPLRNVTLLTGDGGLGKTLLALQLLASSALGVPWLGRECRRVKTLGIFCEDEDDELHRRLADIASAYGVDLGDLEHIEIAGRVGEDNALLAFGRPGEGADATPFFHSIRNRARELGAELIVLDSLYDFFPGNENARTEVHRFGGLLRSLALSTGAAVLVCGHPSRAGMAEGSGLSGSTAWNAVVRSRLYLTKPSNDDGAPADPDARVLATKKANYGPVGSDIGLTWQGGVFVPNRANGPDIVDRLDRDNHARDIVLAAVDRFNAQGRPAVAAPAQANSLPNRIAKEGLSHGLKKAELQRAMVALFDRGELITGVVGYHANRTPRMGVRRPDGGEK